MYTMKESVAVAKEADAKKGVSPTKNDKSIHRVRNEPERQLGSLRGVIDNIRRNGGTPSVENIAMQLSGMHTAQRAPALLALQRTHGNWYVQRVVAGIQAKLMVGQPGDIYEQEADRVADQVMGRSAETQRNHPKTMVISPVDVLNRSTSVGTEPKEEKELQLPKDSKNYYNRPDEQTGGLNRINYGGMPLPHQVRAYFEPRFGHDFGQVKVHHDAYAAQFARRMHAKAFTYQNHIVFGQNQFLPATRQGKRLIAHELVHVVQQTGRKARSGSSHIMHSSPLDFVQRAAEDWLEASPNPADFSNEELALELYSIGLWLQDHPEAPERQHLLIVLDAFETEATTRADQIGLTDVAEGRTTPLAAGLAGEFPAEPASPPHTERPPIRQPLSRPHVSQPVPGPPTAAPTPVVSRGASSFGVLSAAVLAFLVLFLYARESIMSEDEERRLGEEFRRRELERELRARPGPEAAPRPGPDVIPNLPEPPEPRRRVPEPCCCCIRSITIPDITRVETPEEVQDTPLGRFQTAPTVGHRFNVEIVVDYSGNGAPQPCQLQWFEATNIPYILGTSADTEHDIYPLRTSSFRAWNAHVPPCPAHGVVSPPPIIESDYPHIPIREEYVYRYIDFRIRVNSGGIECNCDHPFLQVRTSQLLVVQNGIALWGPDEGTDPYPASAP